MGTGSFPGVKWPGRGVDHLPHLAPRLTKDWSYTSIPYLGLRSRENFTFTYIFPFLNLYNIKGKILGSFKHHDMEACAEGKV